MKHRLPPHLWPLIAAWVLLASATASAGIFDGNPPSDFLPVEEAFSPSAIVNDGQISVRWRIADDYYLYKHALKFELQSDAGASLGEPVIPAGEKHVDDFFGEVETYRNNLRVQLPFSTPADRNILPATLQVRYQGCADAGLCYPPQTTVLDLSTGLIAAQAGQSSASALPGLQPATTPNEPFVSEQDRLASLLDTGNLAWTLLSFLGLGLLLAFTPCILPMIPILSGIIVGRGQQTSAWRGFLLSSTYVLAMALAYTCFGVLAGLFGANLQAALQSPWVLVPFALLFAALALAMFGLFQLQMPSALQTHLNQAGQRAGGGLLGAGIMGFAAALIVGPCLAPPLAGALLYIGSSGNAVLGGAALFALGVGMGLPLVVLGTLGGGMLPKAGSWMEQVKVLFGIILLGVAIWLLTRILPGPIILALWAVLLAGYGIYLGALEPAPNTGKRLAKAAGFLALVYAVVLLLGAALGAGNPLQPLQPLRSSLQSSTGIQAQVPTSPVFQRIKTLAELQSALAAAQANNQAAIVDFYADWCVECVHMEATVFNTEPVQRELAPLKALQVDVTAYDATDRQLMAEFGVIGPPTILFFGADGTERKNYRLIGDIDASGFVRHLKRAIAP